MTDIQRPRTGKDPVPEPTRARREYGHSSEDRNTRTAESQWPHFEGGQQRIAPTDSPEHEAPLPPEERRPNPPAR